METTRLHTRSKKEGGVELMKFTDSQKSFLNTNLKKEIDVLNDCIKWLQEKINKENDIPLKVSCAKQLEIYVEKLEEIEDIFKKINE